MPQDFEDCVSGGGRVRTVKPKAGRHLPVCFDSEGSHAGEVKRTDKDRSHLVKRALRDLAAKWRRQRFERAKKKDTDQ